MTSRIFPDSSIFIEPLKGNKADFYELLISDLTNELYLNEIVVSEYLYYILAFSANLSPKTLQRKKKIKETMEKEARKIGAINNFTFLHGNQTFLSEVPWLPANFIGLN